MPVGVSRTYVKSVDVGVFPDSRRAFQVNRCNQCDDPPCVAACPTAAMYRRPDGIVDFDKRVCIGCKACMTACPYDAIFINPDDHSAEKCNFCAHRLEIGLEPACVVVCPVEAIMVGDLADPEAMVSRLVTREPVTVRRPEKETRPGVFYRGAHQATLDPLAARRPSGGLYAWAGQGPSGPGHVKTGHSGRSTSVAAAVVSYDVDHAAPWGWRVSLYTWTKAVAAGTYLVAAGLALAGTLSFSDTAVRWVAPAVSLAMLAVTAALLIWDLKHPWRFWMMLTRPQWRSWLVRGGVILAAYAAALAGALLAGVAGSTGAAAALAGPAAALAALAAAYTAYLFAQARGRDLWQSPLLAPHLVVQAVMAGAAVVSVVADAGGPSGSVAGLRVLLAGAALAHLVMVLGETTPHHTTAHARLAVTEMVRGRYAGPFWVGVVLVSGAVGAPWIGPIGPAVALAGLLAHEHAYVQSGQSVPLA